MEKERLINICAVLLFLSVLMICVALCTMDTEKTDVFNTATIAGLVFASASGYAVNKLKKK